MSDIDNINCAQNEISRKPFLRQLLICSGVWTAYFMYGLVSGAPTVFIPQIRAEHNSTDIISSDMASWLSSVMNFSGFPCVIILTILVRSVGRKISFMIACIDTLIAFIAFYCSDTVFQILISEIIQGLFCAAQIVISLLILTEYTSPKYRGLFLTIKSATFYWGIWASNALGTFCHWKKIGLLGILCAIYVVTSIFLWPESPYWLASKGKYKECAQSHRWLKGCDEASEKELETLITTQKEYMKTCKNSNLSTVESIRRFYTTITSKEFYKPTLISILTGTLSVSTGKQVCVIYAIDLLKNIVGDARTAYTGMLILDGVTVISMYLGSILSRFLKRRVLLLGASAFGVLSLLILSLYLYLIQLSVITENIYVSLCLLVLFSIAVSCGPLSMSMAVYGELIPIRSRNLAVCTIALVGKLVIGVTLKTAPTIFKTFGLPGTFLWYAFLSSVVIVILYVYLPETKDKTLQEIADSVAGVKRNRIIKDDKAEEVSTFVVSG